MAHIRVPPAAPTSQASWQHRLSRAWLHRGVLAVLLWPASLVYALLVRARVGAYRLGWLKVQRLPVPVVMVGNVVVGGAGKTPTVIAIVRHLQQQGHRPAVISAGHGRSRPKGQSAPVPVLNDTPADVAGDEPLLIRQATGVPVFVARHRAQAGQALLASHPDTTVLVCDDGLQHLALHADVSVAVFDERGVGNGWLLPAGLLREPWPHHIGRPLSLVLQVLAAGQEATASLPCPPSLPVFSARKSLADHAVSPHGQRVPLAELGQPHQRPIAALAGIAKPEAFFDMLRAAQVPLAHCWALSDHQSYTELFNSELFNKYKRYNLIFTEKDAVKLFPLFRLTQPGDGAAQAWAVPLALQPEPAFLAALDQRLSSSHGHQTA